MPSAKILSEKQAYVADLKAKFESAVSGCVVAYGGINVENDTKLRKDLRENGVDVTVDNRAEKIGYKIREAQMKKIPYMLVVGAKEEEDGLVSVRSRFEGDEGQKSLTDFLAAIKMEIQAKTAREVKKEDDK